SRLRMRLLQVGRKRRYQRHCRSQPILDTKSLTTYTTSSRKHSTYLIIRLRVGPWSRGDRRSRLPLVRSRRPAARVICLLTSDLNDRFNGWPRRATPTTTSDRSVCRGGPPWPPENVGCRSDEF